MPYGSRFSPSQHRSATHRIPTIGSCEHREAHGDKKPATLMRGSSQVVDGGLRQSHHAWKTHADKQCSSPERFCTSQLLRHSSNQSSNKDRVNGFDEHGFGRRGVPGLKVCHKESECADYGAAGGCLPTPRRHDGPNGVGDHRRQSLPKIFWRVWRRFSHRNRLMQRKCAAPTIQNGRY